MKRIAHFLSKRKTAITSTITCIGSIILAILANQLFSWLSNSQENQLSFPANIFVAVTIGIGTIILIYYFSRLTEFIKSKIWPEYMDDYYMKLAFLHLRKLGCKRQEHFQESLTTYKPQETSDFMVEQALDNMQLIIQCCYDFFENAFGNRGQLVDDIKFETTFMTKSYNDSEITIPCSANKENRLPTSMLLREENQHIYDNTETAKIYKMNHPTMILVENTNSTDLYQELYADQKKRIRSSVILPVLSHKNELLGTLVVHCNRSGFFRKDRYDFWNELLEMFSVELGYQKTLLDYYINNKSNAIKPF